MGRLLDFLLVGVVVVVRLQSFGAGGVEKVEEVDTLPKVVVGERKGEELVAEDEETETIENPRPLDLINPDPTLDDVRRYFSSHSKRGSNENSKVEQIGYGESEEASSHDKDSPHLNWSLGRGSSESHYQTDKGSKGESDHSDEDSSEEHQGHGNKENGWVPQYGGYGGYHINGINPRKLPEVGSLILPAPHAIRRGAARPTIGYIEQHIDHFSVTDRRAFKMRYMCNEQSFYTGGPLIIFLAGVQPITEDFVRSGQAYDIAEEKHGAVCILEHRFTGKSIPDSPLNDDLLQHLNIDNVLRDIIMFAKYKTDNLPGKNKVGLVGCGYGGTLATWAAVKYPHIIDAVYASGAQLVAKFNFLESHEVLNNVIGLIDKRCLLTIEAGFKEADKMFDNKKGRKYLERLFNACGDFEDSKPQFFFSLSDVFTYTVRFSNKRQIKKTCKRILGNPGTALDKIATYVKAAYHNRCLKTYPQTLASFKLTDYTPGAKRQWLRLHCSELGMFKTTDSKKQPFGNGSPVKYIYELCRDVFGKKYTKKYIQSSMKRTNIRYGGDEPAVRNAIFTHNSHDPVYRLGVVSPINNSTKVFIIQGEPTCADIYSISKYDSKHFQIIKRKIASQFGKWLT